MKKKYRIRLRNLDRLDGLDVGTHEFWMGVVKPEIKNAIMNRARKVHENDKCSRKN